MAIVYQLQIINANETRYDMIQKEEMNKTVHVGEKRKGKRGEEKEVTVPQRENSDESERRTVSKNTYADPGSGRCVSTASWSDPNYGRQDTVLIQKIRGRW